MLYPLFLSPVSPVTPPLASPAHMLMVSPPRLAMSLYTSMARSNECTSAECGPPDNAIHVRRAAFEFRKRGLANVLKDVSWTVQFWAAIGVRVAQVEGPQWAGRQVAVPQ